MSIAHVATYLHPALIRVYTSSTYYLTTIRGSLNPRRGPSSYLCLSWRSLSHKPLVCINRLSERRTMPRLAGGVPRLLDRSIGCLPAQSGIGTRSLGLSLIVAGRSTCRRASSAPSQVFIHVKPGPDFFRRRRGRCRRCDRSNPEAPQQTRKGGEMNRRPQVYMEVALDLLPLRLLLLLPHGLWRMDWTMEGRMDGRETKGWTAAAGGEVRMRSN